MKNMSANRSEHSSYAAEEDLGNASASYNLTTYYVYDDYHHVPNGDYMYSMPDIATLVLMWLREPPYAAMAVLSLIATVANLVTIAAIVLAKSKTPYFRLILNLAISDLAISLSTFGNFIHLILNPYRRASSGASATYAHCMFVFLKNMNNIGLIISLLTLMGMAIDQYIAILHPFKYHTLMSKRRSVIMIIAFWAISIVCGFSDLFTGIEIAKIVRERQLDVNYCEIVLFETDYAEEYIVFAVAVIFSVVLMYIYVKIYGEVRKQRRRVPVNQEFVRNNKALITTLIILGTFLLCWLPLCVFEISMLVVTRFWREYAEQNMPYLTKVNLCLLDLLLVNTIVDPLIYSVRMREVRHSLIKICCCRFLRRTSRTPQRETNSHLSMVTVSTNGSRKPSRVSLGSIHDRLGAVLEGAPILQEGGAGDRAPAQLEDVPEAPCELQEQDAV